MITMKDYDFLYGKMNTIASAASKVVPGTLAILKKNDDDPIFGLSEGIRCEHARRESKVGLYELY